MSNSWNGSFFMFGCFKTLYLSKNYFYDFTKFLRVTWLSVCAMMSIYGSKEILFFHRQKLCQKLMRFLNLLYVLSLSLRTIYGHKMHDPTQGVNFPELLITITQNCCDVILRTQKRKHLKKFIDIFLRK